MEQRHLFQPDWPGFDYIFFDCDSTLSTIEGIDELARMKGKFDEVKRLTDAAMEGEIHLESVYDRRLQLLSPTRAEIREVARKYRQTLVPDVREVIKALQAVDKTLFIVSGGLFAAVSPFGEWLGIPHENIRAVDVHYNNLSGRWWDYQQDRWGLRPDVTCLGPKETPLIASHGKADVVRDLLGEREGRSVLIGDGMSDMAAKPAVDLVIGFGGVVIRERVAAEADVFIKSKSLVSILPLALSGPEQTRLAETPHRQTVARGQAMLEQGQILLKKQPKTTKSSGVTIDL